MLTLKQTNSNLQKYICDMPDKGARFPMYQDKSSCKLTEIRQASGKMSRKDTENRCTEKNTHIQKKKKRKKTHISPGDTLWDAQLLTEREMQTKRRFFFLNPLN